MTPVSEITALRCHSTDGVGVALRDLAAGETVHIDGLDILLRDAVPRGHKLALRGHEAGESVSKYGARIGLATSPIGVGEHVHTHNLATALSGEMDYARSTATAPRAPATPPGTWQGYRRADGRVATRNEVWILPTVGCVGLTAEELARSANARHAGRIDGIHGFAHPHGCSQLGDDLSGTRAVLAALCNNPNAGGILLLGLGCESNQLDELLAAVPEGARARVRSLRAQDHADEYAAAAALIDELVEEAAPAQRSEACAADLCIGLKCGGSDSYSGLTANPLLGLMSDRVAAGGGRLVLTEIPEIFGAEADLFARATSPEVHAAAAALLNRFKRYFLDQGQPVSENPSPGNIAGGITTLEEKSLGAVQKGGRAPLVDVLDYGQAAKTPGLSLLEAPGNDAVSSTALAAAGATMVLFTTGRGTPLGFPVPTVKVASNSDLALRKPGWIDFDAGAMLGDGAEATADAFVEAILAIASGRQTAAERAGQRAIAIWKRGVTL